jgi:hypothetical protein
LGQPLGEGYLTITKEQQVKKAFEYADAMLAEKRNATETSFR